MTTNRSTSAVPHGAPVPRHGDGRFATYERSEPEGLDPLSEPVDDPFANWTVPDPVNDATDTDDAVARWLASPTARDDDYDPFEDALVPSRPNEPRPEFRLDDLGF